MLNLQVDFQDLAVKDILSVLRWIVLPQRRKTSFQVLIRNCFSAVSMVISKALFASTVKANGSGHNNESLLVIGSFNFSDASRAKVKIDFNSSTIPLAAAPNKHNIK